MLSAYIDHELATSEHQTVAEHLLQCSECRSEHDALKRGAALAGQLTRYDAPDHVWQAVNETIDNKNSPQIALMPDRAWFGVRNWAGYATALVLVTALVAAAYFSLFRSGDKVARSPEERPVVAGSASPVPPDVAAIPEQPVNTAQPGSSVITAPPDNTAPPAATDLASVQRWQFEAISGKPTVGAASGANELAVGDFLETDAGSRARITVANIGNVEIEPNSRVKLVGTNPAEHRLSLERGVLQAQITAPPRLFIVDTPSAVAVDLGCAYRLEVDRFGNSRLSVTKGFVALERSGRESIVPAGAACITKRGRGLGTPFATDTTEAFRSALERFDFAGGGSAAVDDMLDHRGFYDMVTLWHLLSRVSRGDREKVFDALSAYVKPPEGVSREGVLRLDKKMLGLWRGEVEKVWFE